MSSFNPISLFITAAVMNKLIGLKEDKSQGPDNIHSALLRNCARTVALLTIIYQKSFSEDTLLDDWKTATVIPIFKKGNKHDASNYRPVSLTSVLCRMLKSIMRDSGRSIGQTGFIR